MNGAIRAHAALFRKSLRLAAVFVTVFLVFAIVRYVLMFTLLGTMGREAYGQFEFANPMYGAWIRFGSIPMEHAPFILAAFLAVVFNLEWNSANRYLALSSPMRRSFHLLYMALAVLLPGAVISIIPNLVHILLYLTTSTPFRLQDLKATLYDPARTLFLLTGMVCFAQGVTATVRQRRFTVWTLTFFAALLACTVVTRELYHTEFGSLLGDAPHAMDLKMGAIFLFSGVFLFDRYAEA